MAEAGTHADLHILCPLQHELALLRRAGVERFATLHCCGPGPAAVQRAVQKLNIDSDRDCIVLIGVAGGLSPNIAAGQAFVVTSARDAEQMKELTPTMDELPEPLPGSTCVACSVEVPVTTVEAKRELRKRSSADIVDLESFAFAEAAQATGARWGIIRGISDGPEDALPAVLSQCVSDSGATRIGAVIKAVLRQPMLIPTLLRLRRASAQSMNAAAELARALAGRMHDATNT